MVSKNLENMEGTVMETLALPPTYQRGPYAIRDSHAFGIFVGSIWKPIVWGSGLAAILTLPSAVFGSLAFVVLVWICSFGFMFWACFYNIKANTNGILTRFGSYSPKILPPGWSFSGPWPLYKLNSGDSIGLEPVHFDIMPKNVDTFEGPGIEGGQITVSLTGMVRVKYPLLFRLCGGWAKVRVQVHNAVEAVVRQYCAFRTFDELKHEKGSGAAAAIFRGAHEWFYVLLFDHVSNSWVEEVLDILVSGCTLRRYLARYGVEIYSLEVQDFTPTNQGLRDAQDLAAIARKKQEQGEVAITAIQSGAQSLLEGVEGLDPNTAARLAAGANNVGDLRMIDMGGSSRPRVLIDSK